MRLLITIAFLLCGCGDHTQIDYHEVPREQIIQMAGYDQALGWTTWRDWNFRVECDIYLAPFEEYKTAQCYGQIVEHEKRHCYEFDFHAGQRYVAEACE